jgi:hypothetical protein
MSASNGNGNLTAEEAQALRAYYSVELDALRAWARRHGHTPSTHQWDESGGRPAASTIHQHWGSWTEACRAAGLQPLPPGGLTNLQRAMLGMPPRRAPSTPPRRGKSRAKAR